jgi:hypothetical protein
MSTPAASSDHAEDEAERAHYARPVVVDDRELDDLAERLANQALITQLRSNALTRYAEDRRGLIANAAGLAGTFVAAGSVVRRVVGQAHPNETVRAYAAVVDVDYDRAEADVSYASHRLRLLALAEPDPETTGHGIAHETLIRDAARLLVAFVAEGRQPVRRLADVEAAFEPLREAIDYNQSPHNEAQELLATYLDAWHRTVT